MGAGDVGALPGFDERKGGTGFPATRSVQRVTGQLRSLSLSVDFATLTRPETSYESSLKAEAFSRLDLAKTKTPFRQDGLGDDGEGGRRGRQWGLGPGGGSGCGPGLGLHGCLKTDATLPHPLFPPPSVGNNGWEFGFLVGGTKVVRKDSMSPKHRLPVPRPDGGEGEGGRGNGPGGWGGGGKSGTQNGARAADNARGGNSVPRLPNRGHRKGIAEGGSGWGAVAVGGGGSLTHLVWWDVMSGSLKQPKGITRGGKRDHRCGT